MGKVMGKTTLIPVMAFSAMLALGAGQRSASPVNRPGQSLHGATAPEGRGLPTGNRGAERAAMENPAESSLPEGGPAKEEKTDCDDCVIVRNDGAGRAGASHAESGADASPGTASGGMLASTLWGLFMVARPKRVPRTIIRGITVP